MFQEIYFWMYTYIKKIKTNGNPADSAYLLVSGLQSMNIGTIYILINYYLKLSIKIEKNTVIYIGLVLAGILFTLNYIILYSKHAAIEQKYISLAPERKKRGKLYLWIYVLLTIFLMFYLGSKLVTPTY
jgi:hypothetical protein